jgi:hypothetical protein
MPKLEAIERTHSLLTRLTQMDERLDAIQSAEAQEWKSRFERRFPKTDFHSKMTKMVEEREAKLQSGELDSRRAFREKVLVELRQQTALLERIARKLGGTL